MVKKQLFQICGRLFSLFVRPQGKKLGSVDVAVDKTFLQIGIKRETGKIFRREKKYITAAGLVCAGSEAMEVHMI